MSRNTVTLSWQTPAAPAAAIGGYQVEVGAAPGTTFTAVPLAARTFFAAVAPDGVYYVRVRALTAAGPSGASNEVRIVIGQTTPPDPPMALQAAVAGSTVGLRWTDNPVGTAVAGYRLEAGSAPGLSNLVAVALPPSPQSFAALAPPGTYFVRLRAANAAGLSAPSNEVMVTVAPVACPVPVAPTGLVATPSPGAAVLRWSAPTSGGTPTSYRLDAGTSSGASNLGSFPLPAVTAVSTPAPPGTYFVRLVAINACGASPPSAPVSFTVPPAPVRR